MSTLSSGGLRAHAPNATLPRTDRARVEPAVTKRDVAWSDNDGAMNGYGRFADTPDRPV
jgi:hypothetical protein